MNSFQVVNFSFLLISIIFSSFHFPTTATDSKVTKIGVIIDSNSPIGRQQEIAIQIAAQNLNQTSANHKLLAYFKNSSADPLQAAHAAEELVQVNNVEVIIGVDTWQETVLVAEICNRAKIPVLSFAAAATEAPLAQLQWPFLVQMGSDFSTQMRCVGEIIRSYKWKKVVAVYEEDTAGTGRTMLARLSDVLHGSGSETEHRLVFPPVSSIDDRNGFVLRKMTELVGIQSRVFVVLHSSLSLAISLFDAASELGFMGKDSVWILSSSVSTALSSSNSSIISLAKGAIGVEDYYSDDSVPFREFKSEFQPRFHLRYPNQEESRPGIHALLAFDSVNVVAKALKANTPQSSLLQNILSTNFTGLTGNISFEKRELMQPPVFKIINFIGKTYDELGFWSPEFGFSDTIGVVTNSGGNIKEVLGDLVRWPGKPGRVPKGWAMPTDISPLKIGIPANTSFEKFVKINYIGDVKEYKGFCIEIFEEVLKIIQENYMLPYEFHPFKGTYDALVENLINETFDAIVGDITILANRSKYVEFTQPFAESGLSMVVQSKGKVDQGWLFVRPFSKEMWLVTALVMIYTTLIVWFLERQSNPEFGGPLKSQISTALWFTFCSLFFTQREKIQSNYSRIVVALWLFVVFVVTSSYQASLTSMLTVPRLTPDITDVESLLKTGKPVGCDGDSFVYNYLKDVLKFSPTNIKNIKSQYDYPAAFRSGNISAAFLELPYLKVFLKENNGYMVPGPTYRFGGLGFAFSKGSPIVDDVSEAILIISENGKLKSLEEKWFNSNCSITSQTEIGNDSLGPESFWGLYLISIVISTISFLLFLIMVHFKTYVSFERISENIGNWTRCFQIFRGRGLVYPGEHPTLVSVPRLRQWSGREWELVSPSEVMNGEMSMSTSTPEIEISVLNK